MKRNEYLIIVLMLVIFYSQTTAQTITNISNVQYINEDCTGGPDADCDGINDSCDICPNGDDSIDNNNDNIPDCSQLLDYTDYSDEWKCGNNKIYVCHNNHVNCINKNALPAHFDHGDPIGPCNSCDEDDDDDCCFPGVETDNTLVGDGNLGNELSVNLSGDPGNQLILGLDGALFVGPDGDSDASNELQTLALSGNDLTISGGNTITLPDNVNDADADPNNELNTSLTLNGTTLELSDPGGTLSVDLSSLPDAVDDADNDPTNELDHDWYQQGGTNQADDISNDIYTNGKVGINTANPISQLHVNGIATLGDLSRIYRSTNNNGWGSTFYFALNNSNNNLTHYSSVIGRILNNTAGSEEGALSFHVKNASNSLSGFGGQVAVFDSEGNFGINELNPTEKLDLQGNMKISGHINGGAYTSILRDMTPLGTDGNGVGLSFNLKSNTLSETEFAHIIGASEDQDNGFLSFKLRQNGNLNPAFGNEVMRIISSGSVGIGLPNPTARFHVKGASNSPFDLTGLFEKQNGDRIFWMNNSGEVYVGEERNATSGGKFLVVTDEPNQKGIVIQNKDDISASAASVLNIYRGTGNAVTLGSFGDVDRAEIRTTETFRTKAHRIQFQASINPAHDDRKLVDIYSVTGGDLVIDAKSNPAPGNHANAYFNLIGSEGYLSNIGTDPDGEARFTNKQENNFFAIQTFGPSYSFVPALSNKTVIQTVNHDLYVVARNNNNVHLGESDGSGNLFTNLFIDNTTSNIGIGTTNPVEKLHVKGNVFADGGVFITSDKRFKKNIQPLEHITEKINRLEGVSYAFKTEAFKDRNFSDRPQIGLIAQNLEEVFPELVKTYADGYKAVNYDGLIPVLLVGLKEQHQIITQLESENNLLNDRVTQLEEENEEIKTRFEELDAKVSQLLQLKDKESPKTSYQEIELNNEKQIWLHQNIPNPFEENTSIAYYIPDGVLDAELVISDDSGKVLKKTALDTGEGIVKVFAANLSSGIYSYSIVINGKIVESKRMVLAK